MTIDERIAMANKRLKEEFDNNSDMATIQYWVGYRDALERVKGNAEIH